MTEVEKKQAMVEFSYANSTRQQVFDRRDIRRMHEVDAMDFDRKWSSSDGNFKVTAALKKILDDKVLLTKTDLEEIEVPVARLSKSDASYVKKIKKNRERAIKRGDFPAPTPELPKLETFDLVGQAIASFSTMDETTLQTARGDAFLLDHFRTTGSWVWAASKQTGTDCGHPSWWARATGINVIPREGRRSSRR